MWKNSRANLRYCSKTFLKLNLGKFLGLVLSVSGEILPEVALEVIVAIKQSAESSRYCSDSHIDPQWGSRHGSGDESRNEPATDSGTDFWNWLSVLFYRQFQEYF